MKLFVFFLMIPLLASCLVEEKYPETSDVKAIKPPPAKDTTKVGAIFVLKGDKNDHIQVVQVLADVQDGMPSVGEGMIQALEWDKNKRKFVPSSDDCVDRYDQLKPSGPNDFAFGDGKWRREWEKNGKILHVTVSWDRNDKKYINWVEFQVPDENGIIVTYLPLDQKGINTFIDSLPNHRPTSDGKNISDSNRRELKRSILNDDDCIEEGSPSGDPTDRPFGG